MGALSAAYCHIKRDFLKSGLYYFYRLPGGIGGMGLCVYLLYLLAYLAVIYLNLFHLFPQYLLKRRYLAYLSLLSAAMIAALVMQMVTEYTVFSNWPELQVRKYYFSLPMIMDYISSFLLTTLCMIGGAVTLLLKEWMVDHQRVSQNGKSPCAVGSGAVEGTGESRTPFQDTASCGTTHAGRSGNSLEDIDEIKPVAPLSTL